MGKIVAVVVAGILAGCKSGKITDDTGDGGAGDGGSGTITQAGFCGVKQLFYAECVSCHDDSSPSGDLDLRTDPYGAIVGVASPGFAVNAPR